ncbi:unnamed protein product [Haemonchus placei]|uniref:Flavodoxin-like domain-containing protein n=1 Tax=Haemonchus placei TaxID=6290 RepID=A0A0N4X4J0_HAEPC|nr:unnamed protein product [Haemonchus placei]
MCDSLRQLWLLTRKNLILTRRNKVWTLFEMILPIISLLPVTLLVVRGGTVHLTPSRSSESVPLEGGAEDFSFDQFESIPSRWCGRRYVLIAYSTNENRDSVEDMMKELAARFSSSFIKVNVVYIKDEAHLLDELRADPPDSGCAIDKFAGGLVFNQFNTKAGKLDYKLLVPAGTGHNDRYWNEEWGYPFDLDDDSTNKWFR